MVEELFSKSLVVFGCGNVLFGDDGFGPEVIGYLTENHALPEHVVAVDVGTSIRDLLFDLLLAPRKPRGIVIVDAVLRPECNAGEVFELDLGALPACKVDDFSLHQFPSVNLLRELRDSARVDIRVIAVQAKCIPNQVKPGLSREVSDAVPRACNRLFQLIEEMT